MADDLKDVAFEAPWTENLRHRPDPNRISSLQISDKRHVEPHPSSAAPPTVAPAAEHYRPALSPVARASDPQSRPAEPSYYDVPILQQPVWKWQIATYFYLGGLSAGAYVLGRAAERVAGNEDVSRMASYVAMATLLPCPPLLIDDLGDPKRFHHMLRVWKPTTPMNLGTWGLLAYSGMAAFETARQFLMEQDRHSHAGRPSALLKIMNNPVVLTLHDMAGIPFALLIAGYTGVLLSCTANPLWCKNPWLGPLFSASALSTGAEAISLMLDLADSRSTPAASQEVLQHVDTVAHAAELTCLEGFNRFAGEKSAPLRRGALRKFHLISLGGIIAAEVLKRLPVEDRYRRGVRMTASVLGLAAGFSLRWAMVHGGHAAAADPHLSRAASAPDRRAKRPAPRQHPALRLAGSAPSTSDIT